MGKLHAYSKQSFANKTSGCCCCCCFFAFSTVLFEQHVHLYVRGGVFAFAFCNANCYTLHRTIFSIHIAHRTHAANYSRRIKSTEKCKKDVMPYYICSFVVLTGRRVCTYLLHIHNGSLLFISGTVNRSQLSRI